MLLRLDIAPLDAENTGGETFNAVRSQHKGIVNGEIPEGLSGFTIKCGMCVEMY